MRHTWWITRPKRDLSSVPLALAAIADIAEGTKWRTPGKRTELAIEDNLEAKKIKGGDGQRRDRGGGEDATGRHPFPSPAARPRSPRR